MIRCTRKYAILFVLVCATGFNVYICWRIFARSTPFSSNAEFAWSWNCVDGKCVKNQQPDTSHVSIYHTLEVCHLVCGEYGSLWPKPTGYVNLRKELAPIHPDDIRFEIDDPLGTDVTDDFKQLIHGMCEFFVDDLRKVCGETTCTRVTNNHVLVKISIGSIQTNLTWDTDESYSLRVQSADPLITAFIRAKTAYGARHGLQTLSQLMTGVSQSNGSFVMMVKQAFISDAPVYSHRGLLVDTSRHFLKTDTIKRTIDGMAQSKLNVLHWHATDTHSFPLKLPRVPELAKYGAYSEKETYSVTDIADLILYGKKRGVRIIMEIDSPSHAGNGWQWGEAAGLGNLAVCVNAIPWRNLCIQPPCGQLNPINPNTYKILGLLYKDLLQIFPKGEVFHMGGDELKISCWNSTPEIVEFMDREGMGREEEDFLHVWAYFHNKAKHILDNFAGQETPVILWSSHLTSPEYIEKYLDKKKFVIQTWTQSSETVPEELLKKGYKLIISTKDMWYLDHGVWGRTVYHSWSTMYDNVIPEPSAGVYGGEVCMWGEYVDDYAIDGRIWPRASAVAERLWSNPSYRNSSTTYRLLQHRHRLTQLRIKAEAVLPQWCVENQDGCD